MWSAFRSTTFVRARRDLAPGLTSHPRIHPAVFPMREATSVWALRTVNVRPRTSLTCASSLPARAGALYASWQRVATWMSARAFFWAAHTSLPSKEAEASALDFGAVRASPPRAPSPRVCGLCGLHVAHVPGWFVAGRSAYVTAYIESTRIVLVNRRVWITWYASKA